MTQTTTTTERHLTSIGEEISHELGAKMVKDFQDANPEESVGNYIGRDILERILAQPGCQGISFFNAINEMGKKTLVYVGVDENNELITSNIKVQNDGKLVRERGIVADRTTNTEARPPEEGGWWFAND